MPTLNEIEHEIKTVVDALEYADPEQVEELQASLDSYLGELASMEADKADSVAHIIREMVARIDLLKKEEKRIKARRQATERQLVRTKEYFRAVMAEYGLKKIQGNSSTLYLRKSEKVELNINPVGLPEDLSITVTEVKPNKTEIKKAIKAGRAVIGCSLVTTQSLNVR